jgi:S1-C subfamily serine protease
VPVDTVEIAAQPCDRPTARLGVGVVVADGLVATAAHVVDGANREVHAGGRDAVVVAVDPRRDLAVLATDTSGLRPAAIDASTLEPGAVLTVVSPSGPVAVDLLRTVTLEVDDVTAGTEYRRRVHVVAPAVDAGVSGAPLLDSRGRLRGIVVLAHRGDDASYAVTGSELRDLLAEVTRTVAPDSLEVAPPCA